MPKRNFFESTQEDVNDANSTYVGVLCQPEKPWWHPESKITWVRIPKLKFCFYTKSFLCFWKMLYSGRGVHEIHYCETVYLDGAIVNIFVNPFSTASYLLSTFWLFQGGIPDFPLIWNVKNRHILKTINCLTVFCRIKWALLWHFCAGSGIKME